MFDWLRKRFVRRDESHAPDVEQARQEQKQKFDEWSEAQKEVRRVEAVIAGKHQK